MSEYNMPPGVTSNDIDEAYGGEKCMWCSHLVDGCCDYGVCELQYRDAYEAGEFDAPTLWESLVKARDWITSNYVDEQEAACARFS